MLVLATGGHWAFLQSVAWLGMAVEFTQNEPLVTALEKTFNGKNPCNLCKAVEEGVKTEKEQKTLKVEAKLELFCAVASLSLKSPASFGLIPTFEPSLFGRADSPPIPPPRFA